MACRSCGSENQTEFGAEINSRFAGPKVPDKLDVLVFPKFLSLRLRHYESHSQKPSCVYEGTALRGSI